MLSEIITCGCGYFLNTGSTLSLVYKPSAMEQEFFHVRMIIGVIVGLSITNLLKGIAKFIVHPEKEKPYWLHLLWVIYFFILLTHFWWWEFALSHLGHWGFHEYLFIVIFATLFFLNTALLFPEQLTEYVGFADYYTKRINWFFAVLVVIYAFDVVDGAMKGKSHMQYLGSEYFVSTALHILCVLILMRVKRVRLHAGVAILFLLYQLVWIYRTYRWLG